MENRYKLILAAKQSYREIELSKDISRVTVGTGIDADVRFREADFYEPFSFTVIQNQNSCQIECGGSIYIIDRDVRKLMFSELRPGERAAVKYRDSNAEVLTVYYMQDFDYYPRKYDRVIDIGRMEKIKIGGQPGCQLQLNHESTVNDSLRIQKNGSRYTVQAERKGHGASLNGNSLTGSAMLQQMDFISVGPYSFCFQDGRLYTDSGSDIDFFGVSYTDIKESLSHQEYPKFNRSTRVQEVLPDEEIEILDPPAEPKKPKTNIVMKLFPAVAMLGVVVLLRGVMNTGGLTYVLLSGCTMGIGIITSVMTIITDKKNYREDRARRREVYEKYILQKRKAIEEYRIREAEILENRYISVPREIEQVESFSPRLFEREEEDQDFLEVRLGTGDRTACRRISYKKQERLEMDDELMKIPEKIAQEYKTVKNVPVTWKLRDAGLVGISGSREALYQMLKLLTLDLAVRHYYTDVQFLYCIGEEDKMKFSWLRMLPHIQNEALGRRNISCDDESKSILLEYLYKELLSRDKGSSAPHIVVFVYRSQGILNHPVSALMQDARDKGITFIYFDEYEENLPRGCESLIRMEDVLHGTKVDSSDGTKTEAFTAHVLEDAVISHAVKRMAPVYCEDISLESALTKNITFFEMMNIYGPEDIDLGKNWSASEVYRSMAAPVGVKSKNQVVYLDLHEKQHGPHGLVAGTTGSGKSEILQTYILSMGLLFHPYEVSFMIIDFKGGGMVNQFRNFPHLAGAITNIDGREINRSLLSIRAELKKRQKLFAQYNVNHIDSYIKLYKQGDTPVPLPHLILIVDEFAELKTDQPEFMKELISAARIGRSLGVHLILATQKPSGVVDPQIWSNSRFKLCLKVQTREDSNEVLKSPLAAEIVEPGRAYLQVGNNEIFELFQSAYSGGSSKLEGLASKRQFVISSLDFAGKRTPVYVQKPEKSREQEETQLESVVSYVADYCAKNNIQRLPYICLPPLPQRITADTWEIEGEKETGFKACIGIYDDPSNQKQDRLMLNVTAANTIIIGSAQNGKTNLLQAVIRSLTTQYTPEEVNLYILDFGSMLFRNYESLHHVGGVVCPNEDEKCKNLFKLLNQEIRERKEKLVRSGVSSFESYLEAGGTDLPQIVVLVDNLTAMRELYLAEDDFLLPVCREGIGVGITFVIANSQTSGIGYKYLANFEQRIALFCNDSAEYSALFDSCRMKPLNVPGRCLTELDKVIYEAQTYLAFEGEKEAERVSRILGYAEEQNQKNPDFYAKKIPAVPARLTQEILKRDFNCVPDSRGIAIGVDFESVEPVELDWTQQNVLAVSGRENPGRDDFISYLCQTLEEIQAETYILDDFTGAFTACAEREWVQLYSKSAGDTAEMLADIEMNLEERYHRAALEGAEYTDQLAPIVFLIQNRDAIAAISDDRKVLSAYKNILNKYQGMKHTVIFTNVDNGSITFNSPEVLKMMKERRQFVVFENLSDIKIFDVPSSLLRRYRKPLEEGEAYLLNGSELTKMKTAGI